MEGTVFTAPLGRMKDVKSEDGKLLTKPFLDVCKNVLPVIDKFGTVLALVKSDINGNITHLESKYSSDPAKYDFLYTMVQYDSSCASGLLWLTRAMDFLVQLLHNLLKHPNWTMSQACTDSYGKTLKKWHGWLARSSFTFAMRFAPNRKWFMEVIGGTGNVNADIEKFCTSFSPLLEENHRFLASIGMDGMRAS